MSGVPPQSFLMSEVRLSYERGTPVEHALNPQTSERATFAAGSIACTMVLFLMCVLGLQYKCVICGGGKSAG